MANGIKSSGNSTADGDTAEVELEAICKDDFSWHPCKVSLCSSGVGLIVEYSNDNSDLDDVILSTEEAVARLRVRSTPLEGVACSIIQQGDRVLAKRNHVNLFFDAEVIQVLHIRHSKKTRCRCTFMVKWMHNSIEGETAIIPSSALMKMSTESIHVHPTIFAFFSVLSTSSCCNVSPLRAVAEGVDCEMDISQLEKQIEQISSSADVSRMQIAEELLSEEGAVDVQEHSQSNAISAPEVCDIYIQLPTFPDCITGSIGQAQCKLPMNMEVKHSSSTSFPQEVFSGSRSPCNPIAACAAFASLMSKSSESTEILPAHKVVRGYVSPPNITNNSIAMKLLNGSSPQTLSFINNSSEKNDESSLGTEAATTFVPNYENIVRELFPTKKPIKEPQTFDASNGAWNSSQEVASCVGNSVSLTTKKMGLPSRSSSAVKRSSGENIVPPLSSARSLTRSVVREIKEKQTAISKNTTEEILLNNSEQKLRVLKRDLLPDKDTVASFIGESGSIISDKLKNQMDKSSICENNVSELRTSGRGMQALNNSRRLMRSGINGKTRKNKEEPQKGLEACSFPEHNKSDWGGNITSESKAPDMEKSISSPVHEICPNPTAEEGYKKVQLSASIKTAHKTEDKDTSNSTTRFRGVKRKSITSQMKELRSSPRLRSLPRTRSQTKS